MFRISRVEELTSAAGWNVTMCWGMSLDLGGYVISHSRRQNLRSYTGSGARWMKVCEVTRG